MRCTLWSRIWQYNRGSRKFFSISSRSRADRKNDIQIKWHFLFSFFFATISDTAGIRRISITIALLNNDLCNMQWNKRSDHVGELSCRISIQYHNCNSWRTAKWDRSSSECAIEIDLCIQGIFMETGTESNECQEKRNDENSKNGEFDTKNWGRKELNVPVQDIPSLETDAAAKFSLLHVTEQGMKSQHFFIQRH